MPAYRSPGSLGPQLGLHLEGFCGSQHYLRCQRSRTSRRHSRNNYSASMPPGSCELQECQPSIRSHLKWVQSVLCVFPAALAVPEVRRLARWWHIGVSSPLCKLTYMTVGEWVGIVETIFFHRKTWKTPGRRLEDAVKNLGRRGRRSFFKGLKIV